MGVTGESGVVAVSELTAGVSFSRAETDVSVFLEREAKHSTPMTMAATKAHAPAHTALPDDLRRGFAAVVAAGFAGAGAGVVPRPGLAACLGVLACLGALTGLMVVAAGSDPQARHVSIRSANPNRPK